MTALAQQPKECKYTPGIQKYARLSKLIVLGFRIRDRWRPAALEQLMV